MFLRLLGIMSFALNAYFVDDNTTARYRIPKEMLEVAECFGAGFPLSVAELHQTDAFRQINRLPGFACLMTLPFVAYLDHGNVNQGKRPKYRTFNCLGQHRFKSRSKQYLGKCIYDLLLLPERKGAARYYCTRGMAGFEHARNNDVAEHQQSILFKIVNGILT